ncbi:MAG: tripartite tricarboxylate transporter substrate binding protein [Burkholderiales bacterium]|nr:tripartite tricarboxylate transporter substrate binding protein [Burkholderiales bacterium]
MSFIRVQSAALAAALVIASFCGSVLAQSYPSKPIRLVLPFPAAGPSDIVGRLVGQKLSEQLGENVVPDNRVGAGGSVGIAAVTKAPPDGYTLMVVSAAIAIIPSLYANLAYDALRDLAPVARLATIENVLLVHPSVPAKTLRQFVTLARANPGKLNYGSGGPGTTNHLANELLKNLEKINMVHVPYKGATLATVALMGGEVDEVIVSVASALPLIQTGRVRPLAVLSVRRVATLPDVPTAKESGVDEFLMSIWYGMFAPAGTPREIISRLNREIMKALESPAMRERMAAAGIDSWPGTPEEMADLLRSETARFAKIIASAGLKKN